MNSQKKSFLLGQDMTVNSRIRLVFPIRGIGAFLGAWSLTTSVSKAFGTNWTSLDSFARSLESDTKFVRIRLGSADLPITKAAFLMFSVVQLLKWKPLFQSCHINLCLIVVWDVSMNLITIGSRCEFIQRDFFAWEFEITHYRNWAVGPWGCASP